MFSYKVYPKHEKFTPSRTVWMVKFCKSAVVALGRVAGQSDE